MITNKERASGRGIKGEREREKRGKEREKEGDKIERREREWKALQAILIQQASSPPCTAW